MADPSGSASKTLTPQRKHHKLLKDGSEVWSEEVEKVFVEGTVNPIHISMPSLIFKL